MATRYCGSARVSLKFVDATNQYRAVVSNRGERKTVYVGVPPASRLAVDSPEAFDQAAHAALSFAADEGLDPNGCELHPSGSGWLVRRAKTGARSVVRWRI